MLTVSFVSLVVVFTAITLFIGLFILASKKDQDGNRSSYLGFWGIILMAAFGCWHFTDYLVRGLVALFS